MRLSTVEHTQAGLTPRPTHRVRSCDGGGIGRLPGRHWRRMTLLLALVLLVGSVGVLSRVDQARRSRTQPVFQSGQIFASVGNSTVNVYDPSSGNLLDSLVDNTSEPYTVDTAFDSQGRHLRRRRRQR